MSKNYSEMALKIHELNKGKIEVTCKVPIDNMEDLAIAYTPGVAAPCLKINENNDDVYKYTSKRNTIAIVSDGSAVLGLGNIGAEASIPVMEGKAILFKKFGGVDAFPICLSTNDVDEIVKTIKLMEPTFGGINLEDISSPRCFEIEKRLKETMDIPVFHDDQHGTAIVVSAAIINAIKLIDNKKIEDLEIVINGPGAAGLAIAKMLLNMEVKNIVLCNENGILQEDMPDLNWTQREMLSVTNNRHEKGDLKEAIKGKDVFIGVSVKNVLSKKMIKSMAEKPIVLAMANPIPEIMPKDAKEAGVFVMGTGRSDFPNQINNVLAFPGIFRGALDVRASDINEEMKIAAANAIANTISDDEISVDYILPDIFNKDVNKNVAEAVKKAAIETGVNRI